MDIDDKCVTDLFISQPDSKLPPPKSNRKCANAR